MLGDKAGRQLVFVTRTILFYLFIDSLINRGAEAEGNAVTDQ